MRHNILGNVTHLPQLVMAFDSTRSSDFDSLDGILTVADIRPMNCYTLVYREENGSVKCSLGGKTNSHQPSVFTQVINSLSVTRTLKERS